MVIGELRVNLDEIPDSVRMELLAVAYNSTVEFFKQPGTQEAFEEWQKKKKEASNATKKKRNE